MNNGIADYMRNIWFHARWLVMSDRDRYIYLWNRARNSPGFQTLRHLKNDSDVQGIHLLPRGRLG